MHQQQINIICVPIAKISKTHGVIWSSMFEEPKLKT